jgi:predicted site-specific integrase-resolvase
MIDDTPKDQRPPAGALVTAPKLAERLAICTKTVDRWVETGILPAPQRIRGRKYWPDDVAPKITA